MRGERLRRRRVVRQDTRRARSEPQVNQSSLLEVRDLGVEFLTLDGSRLAAVRGASFDVAPGEGVGILGESGSGKTTVALALLGLLPPNARVACGSVQYRGRELLALPEGELQPVRGKEISIVFQEPGLALNPVRRAGEQIADVIGAHQDWRRERCSKEALSLLERVCPDDAARIFRAYAHELSGGQRQRVVLAQALACRPALVIADEPTSALDTTVQAEILALLRELKREFGIALLLITHHPAILAGLADRVLVMYAGRIVEESSLADLVAAPLHPYSVALLRSMPALPSVARPRQRLVTIGGNPPDPALLPRGCAFEPRCPDRVEICGARDPEETSPVNLRRVRCFKYGG